jgi:hypothetical protein
MVRVGVPSDDEDDMYVFVLVFLVFLFCCFDFVFGRIESEELGVVPQAKRHALQDDEFGKFFFFFFCFFLFFCGLTGCLKTLMKGTLMK